MQGYIGFILAIVARVSLWCLEPVLFLWAISKRMVWPNYSLNEYFYWVAYSIDQHANVVGMDALNDSMLVEELKGVQTFGNPDFTISYVIAANQRADNLTAFGRFWAWFLERVDPGHLQKAIEFNEKEPCQQ